MTGRGGGPVVAGGVSGPVDLARLRADIATMDEAESWSDRYHDAMVRVLRDVAPLLARLVAAEARAEDAERGAKIERSARESRQRIARREHNPGRHLDADNWATCEICQALWRHR